MSRDSVLVRTFDNFDFSSFKMPLITIYDSPSDFNGKYVARLFDLDTPTKYAVVHDTLEGVREAMPKNMMPMPRTKQDDPIITEVWI